jgi:hypothetical protein
MSQEELSAEEMAEFELKAKQAVCNPLSSDGLEKTGNNVLRLITMLRRRDARIKELGAQVEEAKSLLEDGMRFKIYAMPNVAVDKSGLDGWRLHCAAYLARWHSTKVGTVTVD